MFHMTIVEGRVTKLNNIVTQLATFTYTWLYHALVERQFGFSIFTVESHSFARRTSPSNKIICKNFFLLNFITTVN